MKRLCAGVIDNAKQRISSSSNKDKGESCRKLNFERGCVPKFLNADLHAGSSLQQHITHAFSACRKITVWPRRFPSIKRYSPEKDIPCHSVFLFFQFWTK